MKNILDLTHEEARKFFLKDESYFSFDLPKYFTFSELLKNVSNEIEGKSINELWRECPNKFKNVNYKLLTNKDGKYAWRPFQLIHPALYVALVHKISEKKNWETIRNKFIEFGKNHQIKCTSLSIESGTQQSDKAEQISHWVQEVEQKSIELSLDYEFLYRTDITDCYGSIYTHSVPWALHGRKESKDNRDDNSLVGNNIDRLLQAMSWGQTNGIPQGSTLIDFIAEMVLGYADCLLSERIAELKDFEIIRYRDDYRIFVNNPQDGEEILKNLTEVLIGLSLKLNESKTIKSSDVIKDSIKPDKFYWQNHHGIKVSKTI